MTREKNIFTFPAGLPGLPVELNQYALIALSEDSSFFFLHSLQENDIGFILVNPFDFFPEYEFNLPEDKLEVQDMKDVAVFCIVNAGRGIKEATVNLLAPVVVNTKTSLARQVVLNDSSYTIRQPLPLTAERREE